MSSKSRDDLNSRQEAFVAGILLGKSGTRAAIDAGYAERTAPSQATHLSKNPKVQAAIAAGRKRIAERVTMTTADVMSEWVKIATADPNELVSVVMGPCQVCRRLPGDPAHDDDPCPRCLGEGEPRTVLRDTRALSPSARALYAGAKQTQHGIEIKMRDQDKALDSIARALGMFAAEQDRNHKVSDLSTLLQQIAARGGSVPAITDNPPPITGRDDEGDA